MKLSQLVYECVVNSINIPNTDVNYYSFLNGDLKNNKDYVNQITSVFSALNLSLSRLLNSNKIPYKTEYVEISPTTKNSIYFDKGKVINIVKLLPNGDYERFRFRTLNSKEYLIYDLNGLKKVLVEYQEYIPHFSFDDLKPAEFDAENNVLKDDNIDLFEEYSITNQMCDYIKEMVKGQLLEVIAPDMANLHYNRAEQYLSLLDTHTTAFYQRVIRGGII